MRRSVPVILVCSLGLLYLAACSFPALLMADLMFRGWFALLAGWFPPAGGVVPWLANFPFFGGLSLLAGGMYRTASVLGVIACLLGATAWWLPTDLNGMLVGYFLWQAALVGLALGGWQCHLHRRREVEAKGGAVPLLATGVLVVLLASTPVLSYLIYHHNQTVPEAAGVTPDNFERISHGMSSEEVNEILGIPPGDYRTNKAPKVFGDKRTPNQIWTFEGEGYSFNPARGAFTGGKGTTMAIWLIYGAEAVVIYDAQGRVLKKRWLDRLSMEFDG